MVKSRTGWSRYFLRTLPELEDLLAPLEHAIADVLIPSITGHYCTQDKWELLVLLVRMGGMGLTNPSQVAASEYVASVNISGLWAISPANKITGAKATR